MEYVYLIPPQQQQVYDSMIRLLFYCFETNPCGLFVDLDFSWSTMRRSKTLGWM